MNKSEEQLIAHATDAVKHLRCAVGELSEQIKSQQEWFKSRFELATLHDLKRMENRIMSAIGDWSAKVGPKLDRIQTGLDAVQALVEQLQNSPGAITPEDQALLDQIETKVDAIASDADSVPAPPPTPA